ncbi:SURF1-like protein [Pseudonocardia halophobica]|uniref:SURF1-like protein n=1 Tax=Pseudonocardia halophobica TaxID=29401 RepID=A0A9W6KZJ6_9PSEU|nr:SURF1 family cytochrome oxidase biogenesis protein [Pseudonocardia halophobica]GLL09335.1 SURF1-like protein [Pseudonocardia halophobica]
MRFLLRPSWIAFVAMVVGFAVACYTLLAPWQFGREAQRRAQQQAIDATASTLPVSFATLVPALSVRAEDEWSRVALSGTFLPEAEALVRLRFVDGKPASQVLTPLRLDDGRIIAVDRGSVPLNNGQAIPGFAAAPSGPVTLTGRLRLNETDTSGRAPATEGGHLQIYAMSSRQLAAATGTPGMVEGYVQLAADQPGILTPTPINPDTNVAPFTNGSYALQWLTFGAIAIVALGYFIRLEMLQRRGKQKTKASFRDALAGRDVDAEA